MKLNLEFQTQIELYGHKNSKRKKEKKQGYIGYISETRLFFFIRPFYKTT